MKKQTNLLDVIITLLFVVAGFAGGAYAWLIEVAQGMDLYVLCGVSVFAGILLGTVYLAIRYLTSKKEDEEELTPVSLFDDVAEEETEETAEEETPAEATEEATEEETEEETEETAEVTEEAPVEPAEETVEETAEEETPAEAETPVEEKAEEPAPVVEVPAEPVKTKLYVACASYLSKSATEDATTYDKVKRADIYFSGVRLASAVDGAKAFYVNSDKTVALVVEADYTIDGQDCHVFVKTTPVQVPTKNAILFYELHVYTAEDGKFDFRVNQYTYDNADAYRHYVDKSFKGNLD